jgi:hypothetical protein
MHRGIALAPKLIVFVAFRRGRFWSEAGAAPRAVSAQAHQPMEALLMRSPETRQAHNLKVTGSNPIPATKLVKSSTDPNRLLGFFFVW